MEKELKELLIKGVCLIDNSLNDNEIIDRLSKLYDEISLFNPMYKLVGAEKEELVIKHILDCLAPYPLLKPLIRESDKIADLGSGSGLPGFVLATAFHENSFTLVERMGRRAGFLRNTSAILRLNDKITVFEKTLEDVTDVFDFVTFRAFRPMKDIIPDLDRITKSGSFIAVYKSSQNNINEDLESVPKSLFSYEVINYKVPFLDADRALLVLHKI